jgi:hypothetical protein
VFLRFYAWVTLGWSLYGKWFIHYKINIVKVWSLIDRIINHEYLLIHLFKKRKKKKIWNTDVYIVTHDRQLEMSYFRDKTPSYIPNHHRNSAPICSRPTLFVGFFILLAHWNNSPPKVMSPHSDISSWIRANQSLIFFLNVAWIAEKHIYIYITSFDNLKHWCLHSDSRPTARHVLF